MPFGTYVSGDNAEPPRDSFPTYVVDIASRLDAAARVTIASHAGSSDTNPSPTTAPTRSKPGLVGGQ